MRHRILVIDDEPGIARLLRAQLGDEHEILAASSGAGGLALIPDVLPDVVVCDLGMPGMDGLAVVRALRRSRTAPPVVVTSGDLSLGGLAEILRLHVVDVLVKPFSAHDARLAIARALAVGAIRARAAAEPVGPEVGSPIAAFVGDGALAVGVRIAARRAAESASTLLIEGATGSGKSLLSRAIHAESPCASGPLVEVACGALTESLLEGDLFGHVAGAFTGATLDRPGVLERARHGTLLLDEVSVLSQAAQHRLAHALTTGAVTRLGDTRARPIQARVIATSQPALEVLVERGEFRADLYHALCGLRIRTPALAELPPSDLETLCRVLLERTCTRLGRGVPRLDRSFVDAAARLPWRGNVRELENTLERAILLGDGAALTDAPLLGGHSGRQPRTREWLPTEGLDLHARLTAIEDHYLDLALQRAGGQKEAAARMLGLGRTTLVEKLRRRVTRAAP